MKRSATLKLCDMSETTAPLPYNPTTLLPYHLTLLRPNYYTAILLVDHPINGPPYYPTVTLPQHTTLLPYFLITLPP